MIFVSYYFVEVTKLVYSFDIQNDALLKKDDCYSAAVAMRSLLGLMMSGMCTNSQQVARLLMS